jgi:hypothetical protein
MMLPPQARLDVCMALQQVHAVMLSHHGTVRQSRQVPVASREPPRALEEMQRRRFSRRHNRMCVLFKSCLVLEVCQAVKPRGHVRHAASIPRLLSSSFLLCHRQLPLP